MNRRTRRLSGNINTLQGILEELNTQDFEYFYYIVDDTSSIHIRTSKENYQMYIYICGDEVYDKIIMPYNGKWETYITYMVHEKFNQIQEFAYHKGMFVFEL